MPVQRSSPPQSNTTVLLNFTELSGAQEKEVITISTVESPEPQIVTIESNSNEPTLSRGYKRKQPIIPRVSMTSTFRPFHLMC